MSLAIYKEMRSIVYLLATICKPRTRSKHATSGAHPIDELTDPRPIAKAEAKIEFIMQGKIVIGEETLFIDKVLATTKAYKRRYYRERELDELASANESTIGDKTIIDNYVFEDATFH
jgi:hypothetical protein